MPAQHFIVATAGHVDHGKSGLVLTLTGIDPDRLPEEKARGITIDLGFAHLELPALSESTSADQGASPILSVGIVDVPGHEDFVKNMVAGVGSIDLALFVVAADDGWMPQTEEHLQILSYLGVRHAVVALTKIDLVSGEAAATAVIESIRVKLADSNFAAAPIVATSIFPGKNQGLDALKLALASELRKVSPQGDFGKPRLPIDRVFTMRGIGTVVTGTLNGGLLRRNQAVVVQPSGRLTRIRSLQSHNADVEVIGPGTRAALNLPDLSPECDSITGVARGQVVTIEELGVATDTLDVRLEKSPRLTGLKTPAARPLKDGALVRMHHGSGNVVARVLLQDGGPLMPGGHRLAQLRFEEPIFVFGGDRFVLRDCSEQTTLGGGIILDPDASRETFRSVERHAALEKRAASPEDCGVWAATELERNGAVQRSALLIKTRFSAEQIDEAVARLVAQRRAIVAGSWVADSEWWRKKREHAAASVMANHREHPEKPGIELAELRGQFGGVQPGLFEALLMDLCGIELVQLGTIVRHRSHRLALPPKLQAAGAAVRAALALKPFEPPAKKELAPDTLKQQALRFLLDTGEATEISGELVMQTEHFEQARARIVKFLKERGEATVSDLRLQLNTNRRVIIPLLEKLDRDRVTRRKGDARVLF